MLRTFIAALLACWVAQVFTITPILHFIQFTYNPGYPQSIVR